jgi:hypothetical protein
MRVFLKVTCSVLLCLLLVEGSFHAHGSLDEHASSEDGACFLCTFMSGAENAFNDVDGELCPAVRPERVVLVRSTLIVCPEPRTADGNRSPPSR